MRILFFGDIVGRSGRRAITNKLPELKERYKPDLVIINAENAAGGFGITEAIFLELCDAGADVITTGNHVWDQRETLVYIERYDNLLRPANYPPGTPGHGAGLFKAGNGAQILVVNVMGRVFMQDLDCPFQALERELSLCSLGAGADAIVIDFHAEASSEKQAAGYFVDGRASVLLGTHTHVPTADARILPGGTAFMTDIGMCGDYNSIIGVEPTEPLRRFTTKISSERFTPALGEASLCGALIEIDEASGLARAITPLRLGGVLSPSLPDVPALTDG